MRKKKILFLLEAFDKGGIEKVTLDIVNHLDPEKYDITVQTFWYGGHCQSLVNENIKIIPFFFKRYVKGIIRLIQYLPPRILYALFVHGDYDIEIAASDGGAAKVISGSTNKNAKKICWVHMDVVSRGSKLKEFRNAETARPLYNKFNVISCVSSTCRDKFIEKFGKYPNMVVAHNPIPSEEIREKAGAFKPFHTDTFRFVSVGRLAEEKGYDRLIQAAAQLRDAGSNHFEINIIGDGEKKNLLSEMIGIYHMEGVVNLLGFSDNPYPYIADSDFYVCSSYDEALSLVVGESLALGTPVLATDCAGAVEWLGSNQYGMIVENSTDGLYQGMKHILDSVDTCVSDWTTAAKSKAEIRSMDAQMEQWTNTMLESEV